MLPNDQFLATLDGVDPRLTLHWVTIHERLGRVPEYELEIHTTATNLDLNTLLGAPATICVARIDGTVRFFHGVFIRIWPAGHQETFQVLRAVIVPKLWLAQHTRDCRIFPNATVPEVIKQVVDPKYVPVLDSSLQADAYKKWDYLVQYRESDLNFVSRLMEQEGISYFFQHEQGKCTMVLADSLNGHAAVPSYDVVPVIPSGARPDARDHLRRWHPIYETRSALVTLAARDFRFRANSDIGGVGRPDAATVRDGEADLELYDYAEHYIAIDNKTKEDPGTSGPFNVAGTGARPRTQPPIPRCRPGRRTRRRPGPTSSTCAGTVA